MKKAVIIGIGIITIIIFSFLIANAQNPPTFPVQVYGTITPTLPDGHVIYFKINDLEYAATNIISSEYGQAPLLFIPSDDLATPEDEGCNPNETFEIFIDTVRVGEGSCNITPQEINIALTTQQYNDILGITPQPQPTSQPKPKGGGGGGGGGCFYRWVCPYSWGPCLPNGTQMQLCINNGTCLPKNRTITQECTYVPPAAEPEPEEPEPEAPAEIPKPEKSLAWLLYTIIIIIVAGGLGFTVYEVRRSHRSLRQEMKQPKLDFKSHQNLKDYIRNTIKMGYTRDQIRKELLMEGWSPKILKQVFAEV